MTDYDVFGNLEGFLRSTDDFMIPDSEPYFPGASERCVEIPYVFKQILHERKILDVGMSLADPVYFYGLLQLVRKGVELFGLDIVPLQKVMNRFQQFDPALLQSIKCEQGDIRDCLLASESFELILCVSVLEHVGFDRYIDAEDTVFDRPFNDYATFPDYFAWNDDALGLNEMVRLLKPGGRLLLTVPFGAGGVLTSKDSKGRYAAHLEYNGQKWRKLTDALKFNVRINARLFQMFSKVGWREVPLNAKFSLKNRQQEHVDQGVLCAEIVKT